MNRGTRQRLAAAAVKGDTAAFAQLYGEIYKKLYYYALANLGNSDDAADAVQDAVLDAFRGIGGLKKAEAFESWMFKILSVKIRNKQAENMEKLKNCVPLSESGAVIQPSSVTDKCELLEELAELNEQERLCISLSSIAGYRAKEIANVTGLTEGAVRGCISRGRAKLKNSLKENKKGVNK